MRKILSSVAGFALIIIGLIMAIPGVPGPGLVVAFLGVAMLAEHYHWARRVMDWGKRRVHAVRERVRSRRASAETKAAE